MSNFEHRITEDSTEFEKAFLKIYNGSLWTAVEKMKDWQPPKPLVEVPQRFSDLFDVDLLSSSIDEIERVLIGNKSDEVNTIYLKNAIRFIKTYINGIEENK